MKIIWLGHSGFRIETGDKVLLIDPWLAGNPAFPEGREAEAIEGATHIFLTHGHGVMHPTRLPSPRTRASPSAAFTRLPKSSRVTGSRPWDSARAARWTWGV